MSILKVEISIPELRKALISFKENRKKALHQFSEEIKDTVETSINALLNAEIEMFLGDPSQSNNKRNGYFPEREYVLKGLGGIKVRMPRDRKSLFKSDVIPSHEKMDPRLQEDIAVLHVAGLSTRTLAMISKRLLGVELNKDNVSGSLDLLSAESQNWLVRPLPAKYWALYVDGTNFRIQRRGSTMKEPSLVVLGVDQNNYRAILAIEPGTKDNVESWRAVFRSLKERGLDSASVRLGIMDGLPGLESLFKEEFSNSITQRCWVHSLRNASAKCPKRLREGFTERAHKIMYAASEDSARIAFQALKGFMDGEARKAVYCLEKDLEALLAHYRFDAALWSALRTTNAIENINRQFKRRTKGMETLGEETLEVVLAYVALKIEFGWRKHPITSKAFKKLPKSLRGEDNVIERSIDSLRVVK